MASAYSAIADAVEQVARMSAARCGIGGNKLPDVAGYAGRRVTLARRAKKAKHIKYFIGIAVIASLKIPAAQR